MNLQEKIVSNIQGTFRIEAYQRGYRWTRDEVKRMLEDISEIPRDHKYCLQPIVVKKGNGYYELIDGQQRLTTLYLLMQYLIKINCIDEIKYSIEYTTRVKDENHMGSRELLESINDIDLNSESTYIDELFIKQAYKTISDWFNGDKKIGRQFASKIETCVTLIWYEVDTEESPTEIFTRLNIGKIHLTNAELVKALFLSRGQKDKNGIYQNNINGLDVKRQHEIALLWDQMEKELRDNKFWAFITNEKAEKYPTRMELLFDLIENKQKDDDKYFTFFKFYDEFKSSENKYNTWECAVRDYQQLKEWYNNFDLYHLIGYLVAIGWDISNLLNIAKGKTTPMLKTDFKNYVIGKVRESMNFKTKENEEEVLLDYEELSYENHYYEIKNLLLLFNVETIRQKGDSGTKFPFDRYKDESWTLEHIHAQNSESLKTNTEWFEWLDTHKKSLLSLKESDPNKADLIDDVINNHVDILLSHIEQSMKSNYKGSIRDEFKIISEKVIELLTADTTVSQVHSLSNMALLTGICNSALNNSTFDVKRNRIIEMDRDGDYIPVCTRNVFLKYYSDSDTKLHFWSDSDRRSYIQAINNILFEREVEGKDLTLNLIHSKINYGNKQ